MLVDDALYELPPQAWDAWECFLLTWSQWRVVVGWQRTYYDGIDHSCLAACMDMLDIKKRKRREVLFQLQVIEDEARLLRNAE